VPQGEIPGKFEDQPSPILRAGFSLLLELHDVPTNLPIGLGDYRIDGQSDHFWRGVQTECDFRALAKERKSLVKGIQPAAALAEH
jgi:hypothetical protein